jgi:ATP-dependent Clp protease ATP-binding subunit ClpC
MNKYNETLIKILKSSELEALNLNHQYIGTEHFILAILKLDNPCKNILNNLNITYKDYLIEVNKTIVNTNKVKQISYTPLFKKILMNLNKKDITEKDILIEILEYGEGIGISLLSNLNINLNKLYNDLLHNKSDNEYGINLNEQVKKKNYEPITGRHKELNELIEVLLRKNKNNPLLIGEPGIGKTALVEALAYKIVKKEVPKELLNKTIISINISKIVSGTRYRGEFEEKFHKMIEYFEQNNNLIIFFDEIHTIVGAGGAEGAIDASNILKPYTARNKLKIIGATTTKEYYKSIYNDGALNRRFQTILIKEPTTKETLNILINSKKYYEKFHNVHITNKQLETIIDLSNKYIKDRYNPDKSLDMLDKICSKIKLQHIETDSINNLNELKEQKINYIKNKEFSKAKQISNKINNYKTNKLKIDNNTIYESFNIDKKVSFGFSS